MKKIFLIVFALTASMMLATSCVKDSSSASSDTATQMTSEQSDDTENASSEDTEAPVDYSICEGEVVGGAHSSISIKDKEGEEHEFEYPEINPDSVDTWEEGDQMIVTYVHNPNPEIGDSVVSVRQK